MEKIKSMDIIEAIKERRSVRTFKPEPLDDAAVSALREAIEGSYTLFGGAVTIRLKKFDLKDGFRPSTYGFIKGATDFFLVGMGDDEDSALSAGFRFEQIVLKAWQLGLGTCWIAGTFKGQDFDRGEQWPVGESLKVVCPVGVAAAQRFIEKVGRLAMGSQNRKPFGELFFDNTFNTPLAADNRFSESLEMLRLAPSSTNSQPWRAVVTGDTVHFYGKIRNQVSIIDIGIGLCHFYETELYRGFSGNFFKTPDHPAHLPSTRYIISYTRN